MASRTKQKEEARARRLEAERARAQQASRQRRLRMFGGIVLGAIIVVAVVVALSLGGGSSNKASGLQSGTNASATQAAVTALLRGIPQSGAVLGNPSAKVTMDYYGDLECPICRDFTLNGGLPQFVATDVRDGKVKVVYRAFQTATPDAQTFQTQQVAALAAGEQNKFWNFVELFYHEQGTEDTGYVTESYLTNLAKQAGVNVSQWSSARQNPSLLAQVQADAAAGQSAGVTGTPTLIFSGPKGQAAPNTPNVPNYSDLQKTLAQVS